MPNFQVGFTITAWLPVFLELSILELLTGRVVPVPFDGSTVVEGTVRPTTTSSPDTEVHGILAAGLEKAKIQIKTSKSKAKKYSIANQQTSYLPIASSL